MLFVNIMRWSWISSSAGTGSQRVLVQGGRSLISGNELELYSDFLLIADTMQQGWNSNGPIGQVNTPSSSWKIKRQHRIVYVLNQVEDLKCSCFALPSSFVYIAHRIITLVNTSRKAFLDESDSQESTY
jgi:hypothetical protein